MANNTNDFKKLIKEGNKACDEIKEFHNMPLGIEEIRYMRTGEAESDGIKLEKCVKKVKENNEMFLKKLTSCYETLISIYNDKTLCKTVDPEIISLSKKIISEFFEFMKVNCEYRIKDAEREMLEYNFTVDRMTTIVTAAMHPESLLSFHKLCDFSNKNFQVKMTITD